MRYRRRARGGFAVIPAILAAHSFLQQIKPITRGIELAKQVGLYDPINNRLSAHKYGQVIKNIGSALQNNLGYGRKRRTRRVKLTAHYPGMGRRKVLVHAHYRRV